MYKETFNKSWKDLFNNLQLFIPDAIFIIVSFIVGYFFINLLGLTNLLNSLGYSLLQSADPLLQSGESLVRFLETLDPAFIVKAAFYLALFIVITFFVGSGTNVVKYHMIRNLLTKKKISLKESLTGGARHFFWRYIGMKIMSFIVALIGGIVILLIAMPINNKDTEIIVLMILAVLFGIFLGLWFYFLAPMLFLSNKKLADIFFDAFNFLKNRFSVVLSTVVIILAVGILGSIVLKLFEYAIGDYFILLIILNVIVSLVLGVWGELYKFMIYSKVEKIKR